MARPTWIDEPDFDEEETKRAIWQSLWRGARNRCPNCGKGSLYAGFLKITDRCQSCDEALFHHRANDAPPYITTAIVGHGVVALILWAEIVHQPPIWVHMSIWLPLTIVLSLVMLRPVKGIIVGLQWAVKMHGFDPAHKDDLAIPEAGDTDR